MNKKQIAHWLRQINYETQGLIENMEITLKENLEEVNKLREYSVNIETLAKKIEKGL